MEELLTNALSKASPNVLATMAFIYFALLRPLKLPLRLNAISGYIRKALVIQRRKVIALEKLEEAIVKKLLPFLDE